MKRRLTDFLSAPWLQGVAAISGVVLAVVGIIVAVIVWQVEQSQRRGELASLTSNIKVDVDQSGIIPHLWPMRPTATSGR